MKRLAALPLLILATSALADPRTQCPTPQQQCRVLTLTADEEKVLVMQNGILDTAAQGRNIDLGAAATYLRQKIIAAPVGDMPKSDVPLPTPRPETNVKK
jgi:hypothetical protein